MKNYVLHFIRHGRTEHQRQGVYMGRRTGSELSAEGIGELLALRREYDYPSAEVVFSSPLPHCLQTADFLYPESRLMWWTSWRRWTLASMRARAWKS